jgi:SSS family solute:Na+ symporter
LAVFISEAVRWGYCLPERIEPGYLQGIFVIAFITIVFTVFGGMESVVIADNILTVIMIISVLLMGTLTYLQPEIGGLSDCSN